MEREVTKLVDDMVRMIDNQSIDLTVKDVIHNLVEDIIEKEVEFKVVTETKPTDDIREDKLGRPHVHYKRTINCVHQKIVVICVHFR